MKQLLATISMTAAILTIAFAVSAVLPTATYAQSNEDQTSESAETSDSEAANTSNENYEYIAQPGDSYTKMARKAVQTYGIETDRQIGASGVLFAETNLTSLAGWPELNEGQTVTISKTSVQEWFDKAAKLTAEEKASWEYYVPFVDFNTNSVGEAPKN